MSIQNAIEPGSDGIRMREMPTIFVIHPSPMLTDHLPHGDGLTAFGFIEQLASRGYRLHVAVECVDVHRALPENVTIYLLRPRLRVPVVSRLEYMLRVRLLYEKLRRTTKIDILHQLNPVVAGLSLALVGAPEPLVLGTYVARWPRETDSVSLPWRLANNVADRIRDAVCRLQQRRADAILVTTPAALNTIPAARKLAPIVYSVPQGFCGEEFAPPADFSVSSIEDKPGSILFLGGLWRRKGIFDLVKAFRLVTNAMPEVRLTIAGEGSDSNAIHASVARLPCSDRVHFAGRVSREALPELLRQHNVCCVPSYGEGFGRAIIEAMGCARSIVATRAGAYPFIVDPQGGRLVPVADPESLAIALIEVLASPELQFQMGSYNRHKFERLYAWPAVMDSLECVYDRLIESRRLSPCSVVVNELPVETAKPTLTP